MRTLILIVTVQYSQYVEAAGSTASRRWKGNGGHGSWSQYEGPEGLASAAPVQRVQRYPEAEQHVQMSRFCFVSSGLRCRRLLQTSSLSM